MANKVDIEELFKAGAHFGHKSNKWHPKMAPYIHSKRKGGHIINLERTVDALEKALPVVTEAARSGAPILFVATKTQLKEPIKQAALEVGSPYVVERWFGGMLTNRATMMDRIKRLKMLEAKMESGEFASRYSKLEVQRLQEELDGLEKQFGGIKDMQGVPSVVVIFDAMTDAIAVKEAKKMGVKVIAVCDTNVNPSDVDYVIPANDDATSGVTLIASYFKDAVKAGQSEVKDQSKEEVKE
jgi:small subunit ribosomal protein S2